MFKCAAVQTDSHQLCLEQYGNSEILKDFPITSLPGLCLCNHKRKCTLCVQLKSRHSNHFLATGWERTHPMIGPHVGCRLRASAPRKILPPSVSFAPPQPRLKGAGTPSCAQVVVGPQPHQPGPRPAQESEQLPELSATLVQPFSMKSKLKSLVMAINALVD